MDRDAPLSSADIVHDDSILFSSETTELVDIMAHRRIGNVEDVETPREILDVFESASSSGRHAAPREERARIR